MSILSDIFSGLGIGTQGVPGGGGVPGTSSTSNNDIWKILLGGGLGLAGSIFSGIQGGRAADTIANSATDSANTVANLIREQSAQARSDSTIQRVGGNLSLLKLLNLMGIDTRQIPGIAGATGTSTNGGAVPQFSEQGSSSRFMGGNAIDPETGNPIDGSAPIPQWYLNRQRLDLMPGTADEGGQSGIMGGGMDAGGGSDGLPADFGALTKRFTGADLENEPGFKFRLQEGMKALEHSQAARGGVMGGRAIKEAERYSQDYASGEYSKAYDRNNIDNTNEFNRYATLSGFGNTATAQLTAGDRQATQDIASNTINASNRAADARASGYASTTNALNQGIGSIQDILAMLGRR